MAEVLWSPTDDAWEVTRLGVFVNRHKPEFVGDYSALWQWSIDHPEEFWTAIAAEFGLLTVGVDQPVIRSVDSPTGAEWFPHATVNYAQDLLRVNERRSDDLAIVGISQSRDGTSMTFGELREDVRRCAAGLARLGVERGDRVAAYLPNIPETVVAFLATASLGAVWTSCAPEFGARAVVDRWSRVEPKVLLAIDGYRFGAKSLDLGQSIETMRGQLESLAATVVLRYLDGAEPVRDSTDWTELLAETGDDLAFEAVSFDHPLYILYSSGTTGLPKPIVHGHGGMLLEHTKQLALHLDLGPGDRFFWFTTTGWMMWNFLVSGLAVGSSIVLFDGDPGYPNLDTLWSIAESAEITFFGASAPFVMASRASGLRPGEDHDLARLRATGSTGAPLPAEGFRWVIDEVGDVPVFSISGGTDVCSAFLGGAPVLPVVAGRMACRQLGWAVDSVDEHGRPVRGIDGDLVITKPAPAMPVGFWNDDGSRYRAAYFSDHDSIWTHGDWLTIHEDGSCVVSGRSDATLNRGGVRLGTADFYSIVESDPAVAEALVVHLEDPDGALGELILFVVAAEAHQIDIEDERRLIHALRSSLSPRHAPDAIVQMASVPKTLSGKKLEVPVKRLLQGHALEHVVSPESLADPAALDSYVRYAARRSS